MTAGRAWCVLGVAVTAYELTCEDDELLTEGVRKACAKHPSIRAAVWGFVLTTAAHLLGVLPARCDPFTVLARLRRLGESPEERAVPVGGAA